jgi:AcrR family transcriptional regulator
MTRDETGERILEAAMDMIIRYGYKGATTRKIAAAAGVNEVTLFRKFGTKQQLLQAAIEQEIARFRATDIQYTGDLRADLTRIIEFYLAFVQHRGRLLPTLFSELPRHPQLRPILKGPIYVFEQIMQIIRRYQADGLLVAEPPIHTLTALVGPVVVRGIMGGLPLPIEFPPTDAREHVELFLQGRSQRGNGSDR